MIRNEAEHIFIEMLAEVPTVRKNGITHSDEYFEVMLEDANLPNEEKIGLLSNIRRECVERIKELTMEHCKVAHRVAFYDDLNGGVPKQTELAEKQQMGFVGHVFSVAAVFYIIFLGGILVATLAKNPEKNYLGICLILGYLVSLLLARLATNKDTVYSQKEQEFLKELEADRAKLDSLRAEILSLERLKSFAVESIS